MVGKRQVTTMCPMNCHPTQCGMHVEVEDNKVLSIKGNPHHPESRGFLCIRGQSTREIIDNPKRLLTPLRRIGARGENRWEACSWDDAFAMITQTINETQADRVGIWRGHGIGGTGINSPLITRFGMLGGFQNWNSSIVCWALGGYGLGLTGLLETNSNEDMAENAQTILLWGATIASQPGIARHLTIARKRGAHIIQIDTRRTEASHLAHEVLLIRPGTDAALALSIAHILVTENLIDHSFIASHTLGITEFTAHLQQFTPEWGSEITGIPVASIHQLAHRYATQLPSMIVLGGSSMYKHLHGWETSRAIACLPALIGQVGKAGAGFGPRHGGLSHSDGMGNVLSDIQRPAGNYIPSHMASITQGLNDGKLDVLMIFGSNMLNTFADTNNLEQGLANVKLIVAYDIFMNETIRRTADLILPGTTWLDELGLKQTATHFYLMEPALTPIGETRTLTHVLRELADRLSIHNFYPWQDTEAYLNALLQPQQLPSGEPLTVATLRSMGGFWQRSNLSHIAYPDHKFHSPSGKIEFWSQRADQAGISALPSYTSGDQVDTTVAPLRFCQGRTLTAFHSFYDDAQALPTLAKANPAPELWIHPLDAQYRHISAGDNILLENERGHFQAVAHVTSDVLEGVVWMRDGWFGLNHLTSGTPVLSPTASEAVSGIPGGQAAYDSWVQVTKR